MQFFTHLETLAVDISSSDSVSAAYKVWMPRQTEIELRKESSAAVN